MRTARQQFVKMIAYVVIGGLGVAGCGVRKKTVVTELDAVTYTESLAERTSKVTLNKFYYDDFLSGVFAPDTSVADSAEFESGGIKVTVKSAKDKNGKHKFSFTAKAKPVARSSLTYVDTTTTTVKKVDALKINQENKTVQTRPYWLTGLYLITAIIVLFLMIWVFKKLKSWKKQI